MDITSQNFTTAGKYEKETLAGPAASKKCYFLLWSELLTCCFCWLDHSNVPGLLLDCDGPPADVIVLSLGQVRDTLGQNYNRELLVSLPTAADTLILGVPYSFSPQLFLN